MDPETQNENETEDLETQDVEAQEAEVVEVAIVESDAAPEPAPQVEAARVIELLAESDLDDSAHKWVLGLAYEDEAAVGLTIEAMRTFIADMTPAGQVFGLGETAAVATTDVPKLLTVEELEERARKRTRGILMDIDRTHAGNL